MKSLKRRPTPMLCPDAGTSLVITLAILALISVIVVGFSDTMRVERASARTHVERGRAEDLAQMGVEAVVGQLRSKTANVLTHWVTSPGRIIYSAAGNKLTERSYLFSGVSDPALTGFLREPDLNTPLFRSGTTHLISDRTQDPDDPSSSVVKMPLKWMYVRKNGAIFSAVPSSADLKDTVNPVMGRFAYWADDESCKINCNIAWKRSGGSTTDPSSQLSLTALPGITQTIADTIHRAVTTDEYATVKRFFNTPYDVRGLGAEVADAVNTNKFEITHYNSDPDTTFFNEERIVLTTQKSRAQAMIGSSGTAKYLDILNTDDSNPGAGASTATLSESKLSNTVSLLISYLQRTDWPMVSGVSSFQEKYYSSNPDRLAQLALNIIDYVRCKESEDQLVPPIRGTYKNGKFKLTSAFSTDGYIGMGRTPLINEVGVWMNGTRDQLKVKVEMYLPEHYGIDSLNLAGYYLFVQIVDGSTILVKNDYSIAAGDCNPSSTIAAGGYVTITKTFTLGSTVVPSTRPEKLAARCAFSRKDLARLDTAPLVDISPGYELMCPVDSVGVPDTGIHSMEVDDPRVNKYQGDWKPSTASSGHTFGQVNSVRSVNGPPGSYSPEQDTDNYGKISMASLVMPYPKGHSSNPKGIVTSPGELGLIHTGIMGSAAAGVPWRTLRLQPNAATNTSVVPDWALMDLFTVAQSSSNAGMSVLRPHSSAFGGRVNINAKIQPFGVKDYYAVPYERYLPMACLFDGAQKDINGTTVGSDEAKTIARNIYAMTLAAKGKSYGREEVFDSPGEIVEVAGVADGGEESEALVRDVINRVTVRGNVFSIYAIGQSLTQTPAATLVVNAEQRIQTTVERIKQSDGSIQFKTIYHRNLTP